MNAVSCGWTPTRLEPIMPAQRERARDLLNYLAPEQIAAVVHLMEVMLDPLSRKLANAPLEDEAISEEEDLAVAEAREWSKHNQPIPNEDVLSEFGLTLAEFERLGQTPPPDKPNGSRS
jgi:hypothetical protein